MSCSTRRPADTLSLRNGRPFFPTEAVMITRPRLLLSVAALALLTTSCLNDPVGPETTGPDPFFPVFFEAVSANAHPLPAFINADGSTQAGRQLTSASVMIVLPNSLRLI